MTETSERTHGELSDSELRARVAADAARVRDVRKRSRTGAATTADLIAGTEAARSAKAGRAELMRRTRERDSQSLVHRVSRRAAPLSQARERERPLLDGVALDHRNLSDEELAELRNELRALRDDPEHDRRRYELLLGKAGGDEGLLDRLRSQRDKEAAMRAEATKLARTFLPKRRDPEPGSIELPRFLWGWLTDGREDTFDVADLGVLAAVAFAFANEDASLFAHGRFITQEDGSSSIVVTDAGQSVRLAYGASDGRVQVRHSLDVLKRNRWIELSKRGGTLTITQGERMRELWR